MARTARLIDFGALTAAAFAAPASSFLIYGAGWLAMAATHGGQFDPTVVPFALMWVLLVAGWGFTPAFIFGGAAMAGLTAWLPARAGRWPARVLTGLGAAGVYSAFGLGLAQLWSTGALFIAPWAVAMTRTSYGEGPPGVAPVAAVIACILASGAIGGWVYLRLARRG